MLNCVATAVHGHCISDLSSVGRTRGHAAALSSGFVWAEVVFYTRGTRDEGSDQEHAVDISLKSVR